MTFGKPRPKSRRHTKTRSREETTIDFPLSSSYRISSLGSRKRQCSLQSGTTLTEGRFGIPMRVRITKSCLKSVPSWRLRRDRNGVACRSNLGWDRLSVEGPVNGASPVGTRMIDWRICERNCRDCQPMTCRRLHRNSRPIGIDRLFTRPTSEAYECLPLRLLRLGRFQPSIRRHRIYPLQEALLLRGMILARLSRRHESYLPMRPKLRCQKYKRVCSTITRQTTVMPLQNFTRPGSRPTFCLMSHQSRSFPRRVRPRPSRQRPSRRRKLHRRYPFRTSLSKPLHLPL